MVYEAAKSDKLAHFRLNLSKIDEVAAFVQGVVQSTNRQGGGLAQ